MIQRKKYAHWDITKDYKKLQGVKEIYYRDPQSKRQCQKMKYQKNPKQQ